MGLMRVLKKMLVKYWIEFCKEDSPFDDLKRNMSKYSLMMKKF